MRLITSPIPSKKYRIIYDDGKHIDFGASGYSDYTLSKDENKKKAYISRHKVNEDWTDPYKAGTLSRFILWNLPTVQDSYNDYKKRFGF